ncbi:MAG: biosynthetic-type acetolactate synthase large subunit [Candidatus Omnitrophota bacterium]|nr:biosynthetic-type acetolactate synthase large subunit [Candidatus Omnitrophota bacterium]
MNGSQILVEALKKEGVKYLFGIPGGQIMHFFDALYQQKEIELILTRHEQAAAHMADGYARATGKVGVCVATSGPGATNLVTGLATAYMDSIPMVAITGQVPTHLIGNDAFQEADTTGITRPVTKNNYLVKDVRELSKIIKEAFYVATSGRPGPVLIDFPSDIQRAETEFFYPHKVELKTYRPRTEGHARQIKKAAELILSAKRPIIYAGGGVLLSKASQELTEFAHKTGIPVILTLMGLGSFPADDPLFSGMPGMHGPKYANYSFLESDLVIAIGARFDDRVTGKLEAFKANTKFIHIDIDPSSIGKIVPADVPIVGDVKKVLNELIPLVSPVNCREWREKIASWKTEYPLTYQKDDGKLRPQFIIEEINRITEGKALIATDVGQHQMWVAQFYRFNHPNSLISSGGLGTMGFGFPAAIGAKFGCPDRIVFDISGDGSFQMNIQELTTAVINRIPIKVAILNNCYLGMVRQWQELFYGKRYSGTHLGSCPDFARIAEAFGAKGRRVTRPEEVEPALKESLKETEVPFVMDFRIEQEENVFPMVPAGASLDEMISGLA